MSASWPTGDESRVRSDHRRLDAIYVLIVATTILVVVAIIIVLVSAGSSHGPVRSTGMGSSAAPATPAISTVDAQYLKVTGPLNIAIQRWDAGGSTLNNEVKNLTVPSVEQVSAVESPFIGALSAAIAELQKLSVPPSTHGDLNRLIGDMGALEGYLKQIVNLWPDVGALNQQVTAEIAQLNSASAIVGADLHLSSPQTQ